MQGGNGQAAHHRVVEKQREYQAFLKIAAQNKQLRDFLSAYSQQLDGLGNGTASVAEVVEHWQSVFRITHVALASLAAQEVPTSATDDTPFLPPGTLPDRIVRIPSAVAQDNPDA